MKDVTCDQSSEPPGLQNKDSTNFMKNVTHAFLSKEGVFTDFTEGLKALSLTSNGHELLNMLLSRTHGKIIDIWYCETSTPKFSDTNNLSD